MIDATDLDCDCLVVGAGPAGLVSATYLARFRRRTLLVDAGDSRASWIARSQNIPGFPDGISGADYLERLRRQSRRYGIEVTKGRVEAIEGSAETGFRGRVDGRVVTARRVILATGYRDRVPDSPAIAEGLRDQLIHLCPICDGFEVVGRDVALLGPPEHAAAEAAFLSTYARSLTLLRLEDHPQASLDIAGRCAAAGWEVAGLPVESLAAAGDHVEVRLADGGRMSFDALYVAMGGDARSGLADALGARRHALGYIETDDHQRTTVPGVYAVGDVVDALNQISVAVGHAAIAATDVHNALRREDAGRDR